jgi:biopolymer transport protein ExbB/TolQ
MTRPLKYITRMLVFLGLVVILLSVVSGQVYKNFVSSIFLNSIIVAVYIYAIIVCFRQVIMLNFEVDWLNDFLSPNPVIANETMPNLISPVARLLREHQYENGGHPYLSTQAMNSLLDIIYSRLNELRENNKYFINILISLGLLGTFWGLVLTLSSISDIIKNLSISGDNLNIAFETLKQNLGKPLGGMSTAFSTSLFGLFGSISLGFLDLQAAQAQTTFYNQLEEKLSGLTRLSEENTDGEMNMYLKTVLKNIQVSVLKNEENMSTMIEQLKSNSTSGRRKKSDKE